MGKSINSAKDFNGVKKIALNIHENLDKNNSYIEEYKEHLDKLKKIKENICRQKFNLPNNLYAYSSIGGNCGEKLDLRILGQSVGTVKIKDKQITFKFKKGISNFIKEKEILNNIDKDYQWDKISEYRKYIKSIDVSKEIKKIFKEKKKNKEAGCESIILNSLSGKKFIKIKKIVPVMIANKYYFQLKTKISASKNPIVVKNTFNKNNKEVRRYGGGVDILARTKDRKLCIIELKDDNTKSENAYKVLGQAIAYSVFVGELFIHGWNDFFGFSKKKKCPTIHAVVCMPSVSNKNLDITEFGKKIIEIKDNNNKNTKFKIDCHYIYYDKNKIMEGKFVPIKNSLGLNDK